MDKELPNVKHLVDLFNMQSEVILAYKTHFILHSKLNQIEQKLDILLKKMENEI